MLLSALVSKYCFILTNVKSAFIAISVVFFVLTGQAANNVNKAYMEHKKDLDTATFGGGCFWCIEAIFEQLTGVKKVVSGYAGGETKNPTYGQVCSGETGHAEVCQVIFDSEIISYKDLLLVFFASHDPTTPDRQGPDFGSQYRSIILYHDDAQKNAALTVIKSLTEQKIFSDQIVTELAPLRTFYAAEEEHQHYFANNPNRPYCTVYINPKIAKIRKNFSRYFKK